MAKQYQAYDSYYPTANSANRHKNKDKYPVSIKEWVVSFILLSIPLVNIICIIKWAFSKSTPISKKNYARAILIITIIVLVISSILVIVTGLFFDFTLPEMGGVAENALIH